jgi:flagellar capping protein FliD
VGTYAVSVSQLARGEQWASATQSSTDIALNKTGTFWLGGTGTASTSFTGSGIIASVSTGSVASGLRELGTGLASTGTGYTIETRDDGGTMQFRIKDADGNVVSIADKTKTDNSVTTAWQAVTPGETYDTKRGLVINFESGSIAAGSASIDYTAAGKSVSIVASDTLVNVASKINAVLQPDGRDLIASVVGNTLVFNAAKTGSNHTMIWSYNASSGGDWGSTPPPTAGEWDAKNALFTVNGLSFSRSSNTNLTNVISGVTLNLAADAAGRSAKVNVSSNWDSSTSSIESFLTKFNEIQTYLEEKTAITALTTGETVTYTRGALADDNVFSDLRSDLFSSLMSEYDTGKAFNSLRQIGITIDDNLQASISDSSLLENALSTDLDSVKAILDSVMNTVDTQLGRFTGSSSETEHTAGYLDSASTGLSNEVTDINNSIEDLNERLADREQFLVDQYSEMQSQLYLLSYTQQMMSGMYGSINSLA